MKLIDKQAARDALYITALLAGMFFEAFIGIGIFYLYIEVHTLFVLLFLPYVWLLFYSGEMLAENL